jgi:hypothetical protein
MCADSEGYVFILVFNDCACCQQMFFFESLQILIDHVIYLSLQKMSLIRK